MEHIPEFVSARRISGTLKLRSNALGSETALQSQAPRETVRLPDEWEVIEASWAAMAKRLRGGCAPRAVDLAKQAVLAMPPEGDRHAKVSTGLLSVLIPTWSVSD